MSIQLDKKIEKAHKLDEIDYKIICQLILGSDNKNISSTLHIALSTIQRRTRSILSTKIIEKFTPNSQILGITKVYCIQDFIFSLIKFLLTKYKTHYFKLKNSIVSNNSESSFET